MSSAQRRKSALQFMDTYGTLKRCFNVLAARAYARTEMGTTQVRFIRQLSRSPGSSQADLARATGTDPALAGRVLQNLIQRKWVVREPSPTDGRGYVLNLSAAGRRQVQKTEGLRDELVKHVAIALDERDVADFERIAQKLLAELGPTVTVEPDDGG